MFVQPGRIVQGKQRQDQQWIDGTIERGVTSCGWKRVKKVSKSNVNS